MMHAFFRRLPFSFVMLLVLIASLPFSYVPVLQLGTVGSVHVDVAWIYGVSLITVLVALPALWRERKTLFSQPSWQIFACWLLFMTLSLVWTADLTRGLITIAFAWLLFALASTVVVLWPLLKREKKLVLAVAAASIAFSCLFALWQLIGDALGISPTFTLLPESYRIGTFSFARPTGFALEPQFFASILLAPWLFTLHGILRGRGWKYIACFGLLTIILGITLSRGAFVAMAVSGIILLCSTGTRLRRIKVTSFGLSALLVAMLALVTVSSLAAQNSAYQTLDTTLNQISLGVIDLPSDNETQFAKQSSSSRIEMAALATEIWSSHPTSLLIGAGIGGFGEAAHAASGGRYPEGLVANNYYAEMLAEQGLVGVTLFILFIGSIFVAIWRTKQWLLLAILGAYLVQWSFFSGNANIIHIWIFFGLVGGFLFAKNMRHSPRHLIQ